MAVGAFGIGAPPPDRALIIPQFAIECLLVSWAFAAVMAARLSRAADAGGRAPSIVAVVAVVACAGTMALYSASRTVSTVPALRVWAESWDRTDRTLRAAASRGEQKVVVHTTDLPGGLGWISEYPRNWVNRCVATYYHLDSVTGR
jgi:hypothetical protein